MTNSSLERSPKKPSEKIAISGAEIVLLALLVIGGIGIWAWVERGMRLLLHEPNETSSREAHHVFELQDELLRVQNERHAFEANLTSARLDQLAQTSTITAITAAYP